MCREMHPMPAHEGFKDREPAGATKELRPNWRKNERHEADKTERRKKNEKQEASNKVSPQSLNMSCDNVDQIPAKMSDLSVCG